MILMENNGFDMHSESWGPCLGKIIDGSGTKHLSREIHNDNEIPVRNSLSKVYFKLMT